MPVLKILVAPNPILRKKSTEINLKKTDAPKLKRLIAAMIKTMIATDGVGLAAPQIGKNSRLVVINSKDGAFCLINPKITKKSWAKELGQEGCLSLPGIFGQVKRPKKISLTYLDADGHKIKSSVTGLMARVAQHEIDHLDGVLFIDKAARVEKIKPKD